MSTTIERKPVSDPLRQSQRRLLARLRRVRRQLRMHLLVEGVFWITAAVLAFIAGSLLADWLLRLSLPARLGLLAVAAVAIVVLAFRRLIRPLLLPLADLDLAELLDRRKPGVGQQIANVLQLPDLLTNGHHASSSMVHAAVDECAQSLERVDLGATLNLSRRRKLLSACIVGLLLAAAFAVFAPQVANLWARRWFAGSNVRWPQHNYLNVISLEDGDRLLVPRGETSLLQINAQPKFAGSAGNWVLNGRGEPLVVESTDAPQPKSPEQVGVSYVLADGTKRRGNAAAFDEANFRYELPPLAEPVTLEVNGGDDWLGPITIEPIDRPSVSLLELTARRPGSGEEHTERIGEGTTQLLYLPETPLELRLVANQPLASAEAFDKGTPLSGLTRVDDRTYTLTWTMKESLALEFRLVGDRGSLSSKPYFLTIGLLKDREPRVTVHATGVGRRVTPVARIPLVLHAMDDFGVMSLALDWELSSIREEKPHVETSREDVALPADPSATALTDLKLDQQVALTERKLSPGTTLKLRGAAADNCALGAQAGNSRWLTFQIVTAEELFYEILMRQREQRARFTTAYESAQDQAQLLKDAAKPADAVAVARAQQVISRQVWQVASQLDQTHQEMTLNDLGNPQARDNLQTAIIAPMRKLHGDLLANLRSAVDELSRGQTIPEERRTEAVALADQSVAVMKGILAQMSLWESFIDVINQLKQVIDRQDGVLKATEEADKQRTDKLFDD